MIQQGLIIGSILMVIVTFIFNYYYTTDTVTKINQQLSELSTENKQDLANAVILQDQLDQLVNNINKVQLTRINDIINKMQKQFKTSSDSASKAQQQFNQQMQQNDIQLKQFQQQIATNNQNFQTITKNVGDLSQQLNSLQSKLPSDAQNALTKQSIQQVQDLIKQVPNFQKQLSDLTNTVNQIQNNSTQNQSPQLATLQQQVQSLSNINSSVSQLQQQVQQLQTTQVSASNTSAKLASQYLMIQAQNTNNDPTANGIYILASTPNSVPSMTVRTALNSVTNPYISIDSQGQYGWSLGNDVADQNKFKIIPNWSFDKTKTPAITLQKVNDTTNSVGINNSNPTQNANYVLSSQGGRSKIDTLDIGTPIPPDPAMQAKINIGTTGANNPANSGIYTRAQDNNSDAIILNRVPNQSTQNPFVSFDHDGVIGWSVGLNNKNNNSFTIANAWDNLNSSPRMIIDTNGNIKFNTNTFSVCDNSGNNCKQLK